MITLVTECQPLNVPPMLVLMWFCGRNFGLCLLHAFLYICVYLVMIKENCLFFKFTHIFQLRRFADYIDLIHFTVLFYDADYCEILSRKNVFAVSLHHGHLLKASVSCSFFFPEHREYFPNPCLSLPPITGANVILSLKLLTCFFPFFGSLCIYLFVLVQYIKYLMIMFIFALYIFFIC